MEKIPGKTLALAVVELEKYLRLEFLLQRFLVSLAEVLPVTTHRMTPVFCSVACCISYW